MTTTATKLQHLRVKLYASRVNDDVRTEEAINVFHGWIRESKIPELLIDVADYSHVPFGPGVLLVGHESHYAIEEGAEDRLGLLYVARTERPGSNQEQIEDAIKRARHAADLLAADPVFAGRIEFGGEAQIGVNDRLLAPNTQATFDDLRSDIEAAARATLGGSATVSYEQGDARSLFCVSVMS